ncbi:MAG TPA: MBL fold metallo-hydrolase RNA specificity domain-containing protein [Nitrososphaeraceae archaeon]|nr:MBL fold metallo-hydrolase RNA specificity domain-containing protein [Nitrososphaeraceae archaeon]
MGIGVGIKDRILGVHFDGKSISLDPKRDSDYDFMFVSHAHTDHLFIRRKKAFKSSKKILASHATSIIANFRGHDLEKPIQTPEEYHLVDTGHILGSRGFLIPDELFYTGDISMRNRAFLSGARLPQARHLIIESTFARPEYVFPSLDQCIHQTNEIISEMYDRGIPIILMGYPLGKAQLLTELFKHWDPMIVHESVHKMNSVYKELGVPLKECLTFLQAKERGMFQHGVPWVMISPFMSGGAEFVKEMKSCCKAVTVGFTGWAIGERFRQVMGLDYAIPLSDHCDYLELLEVVKHCKPEKVYTIHGFADDFASKLRAMGYDAQAISPKKKHISENSGRRNESLGSTTQTILDPYFQ